jgi:hypothetical protein
VLVYTPPGYSARHFDSELQFLARGLR